MKYRDLRDFIKQLEKQGELKRVTIPVDPYLEMTEICDRTLKQGGPALLFENPTGYNIPVLANLFGTPRRVAMGMGAESVTELRGIGELLATLKEPEPPKGMKDAWEKFPVFKQVLNMAPKLVSSPPCQELVREGDEIDLSVYPYSNLLAGRCRAVNYLAFGDYQRPQQRPAKSGHLSPASHRQKQSHHALAGASGRRLGF